MPQTCHWDGQSVGPQWVDSACSSAAIADVQQHSGCLTDNVDFSPETRRWTGASLGARDDRYVAVTERSRRSHEQQQPLQSRHQHKWMTGTNESPPHPPIKALTCSATTHPMPTVQTSERKVALSAT